jgi:hypothetical protein
MDRIGAQGLGGESQFKNKRYFISTQIDVSG